LGFGKEFLLPWRCSSSALDVVAWFGQWFVWDGGCCGGTDIVRFAAVLSRCLLRASETDGITGYFTYRYGYCRAAKTVAK
jgi:hypothetical protein